MMLSGDRRSHVDTQFAYTLGKSIRRQALHRPSRRSVKLLGSPGLEGIVQKSKHRRRRRSRSRRREGKKARGSPSPVVVEDQAEVVGTEPEENDEIEEPEGEEEEPPEVGSQDDEVEQNPKKFELRQTAKPSSRKPLPRRPRTPSVSPPGYHSRDPAPLKRWKGWQHVYRGQQRQAKGKGKGAPQKGSHGAEGDEKDSQAAGPTSCATPTSSSHGRRGRSGQGSPGWRGVSNRFPVARGGSDVLQQSLSVQRQSHGSPQGRIRQLLPSNTATLSSRQELKIATAEQRAEAQAHQTGS